MQNQNTAERCRLLKLLGLSLANKQIINSKYIQIHHVRHPIKDRQERKKTTSGETE